MNAFPLSAAELTAAERLVREALDEDLGNVGDLTSESLIDCDDYGRVNVVVREPGVICGLTLLPLVYRELASEFSVETRRHDGVKVTAGATIATVSGPLRGLLTGERSALNFLGHLSGVATVTRRFVDAIAGTGAKILDTRKTLPGVRLLQKYAVRCGGGTNHRMGLFDAVMIKDNHLAVRSRRSGDQSPAAAVRAARSYLSERTRKAKIVVEIDSLDQLPDALCDSPDVVLLDNMTLDELRHCVRLRNQVAPAVGLEASGGIRLDNVRSVAETGVERISVGALTHSAPSLDVAFDWQNGDSET